LAQTKAGVRTNYSAFVPRSGKVRAMSKVIGPKFCKERDNNTDFVPKHSKRRVKNAAITAANQSLKLLYCKLGICLL